MPFKKGLDFADNMGSSCLSVENAVLTLPTVTDDIPELMHSVSAESLSPSVISIASSCSTRRPPSPRWIAIFDKEYGPQWRRSRFLLH